LKPERAGCCRFSRAGRAKGIHHTYPGGENATAGGFCPGCGYPSGCLRRKQFTVEMIWEYSGVDRKERRPGWQPEAALEGGRYEGAYLAILYVRSPAAFLEDSIVCPPLLPKMLTKPRTV
jgi:hypothetical protein